MMPWRPCGACAELVPADTGCGHWRPGNGPKPSGSQGRKTRARSEAERQRAEVEAFRRTMTRGVTG